MPRAFKTQRKQTEKRGKVRNKQVPSSQQVLDFNVNETWLSNILLFSSPSAMTQFQMWWRQNLTTFLAEPSKSCQPSACGTKSTLNTSGTITHCAFVFETRATLAQKNCALNLFLIKRVTTVFVDTRLRKTKHPRKRF